jgi:general secretion pathway protein H
MSGTGEPPREARPDAGETLIEALVVVAIISLVSLIGFPQLQQSLLALSQQQAVAVVAARLRAARADALSTDTPVVFRAAADGRAYGVSNGPATTPPPGVTVEPTTSGGGIAFYGDGSSSGGRLMIRASKRAVAVTVVAPTGVVIVGGA